MTVGVWVLPVPFSYPFAHRHLGDDSEVELRDWAQQSIWQMETQIQHLREEFDLGTASPAWRFMS